MKKIVEANSGDWTQFEPKWRVLSAAMETTRGPRDLHDAEERIATVLEDARNRGKTQVDKDITQRVTGLLKVRSHWDEAKTAGVKAVPSGDASEALQRLVSQLHEIQIFPTLVGELERFIPSVGGHGPQWVSEVHARALHKAPEADDAKQFVRRVVESLS